TSARTPAGSARKARSSSATIASLSALRLAGRASCSRPMAPRRRNLSDLNRMARLERRDDLYSQLAHAIDARVQLVSRLDRAHAGRRAGVDDVARLEAVVLREEGDLLGHRPDHVREIGLLAVLAVHLEPDRAPGRMADLGGGRQRAAGRRFVE